MSADDPAREFWFSQALQDGGLLGDYGERADEWATPAESGLIEVIGGRAYVERHAAPWWLLPGLPDDAVRLRPAEKRCASCEHRSKFHAADTGECWLAVTKGRTGAAVGCACAGWIEPDDV